MQGYFYRRNKKSIDGFLDAIEDKELDHRIREFSDFDTEYRGLAGRVIGFCTKHIKDTEDKNKLKTLHYVKKRVNHNKSIPEGVAPASLTDSYNKAIASRNAQRDDIISCIDNNAKKEEVALSTLFSDNDVFLLRNKHLAKKINLVNKNHKVKFRKKEYLSLYKFAGQISVKTGAVGTSSEIGYIDSSEDKNEKSVPKHKYVIRVQEYISNRIFERFLVNNLSAYLGDFFINNNYASDEDHLIFKVLIDDESSNIYRGMEREVRLLKTEGLRSIIGQKSRKYSFLSKYYTDEEISTLIKFGIITFDNKQLGYNFSWINDFSNDKQKEINEIFPIQNGIEQLQSSYEDLNGSELSSLETRINELCEHFSVADLNLPLLTIDAYDLRNDVDYLDYQHHLDKILKKFSKFMAIFDASKIVEEACKDYMIENGKESVQITNSSELDDFFSDLAEYVFKKINLGALRSGFFEGDFPLIQQVVQTIKQKNTNGNDVLLTEENIDEIFKSGEQRHYNFDNNYAFFLQKSANMLVVNHVYKGYGVFNRRYRSNFPSVDFNENYGYSRLLDMPYYFGFNANLRSIKEGFDPLIQGSSGQNVTPNNLVINADREQNNIRFFDGTDEIHFAFLGSMTPMVLPKTLAMFNSVSLTGGMYFDLGDLVLRDAYSENSDLTRLEAPRIMFMADNFVVSRKKVVMRTNEILKSLEKRTEKLEKMMYIQSIFNMGNDFFLREFSVDMDFKNKFEKPVYIKVFSSLSLDVMIDYFQNVEWIVAEEVCPTLSRNANLVEYIVETPI